MTSGTAKMLRLAAMAGGLLCGLNSGALRAADEAAQSNGQAGAAVRLAAYETAILAGDPAAAVHFLKDGEARDLAGAGGQKSASLPGRAEALADLKDLLALSWDDSKANQLNQSLSIRIDVDEPLSKMGIGPEPEKLFDWLARYQPEYPATKKAVLRKAIRQWEVVFGTMTDTRSLSWGQADLRAGYGVTVTRPAWEAMVLRERNAVIENILASDPRFLVYDDEELAAAKNEAAADAAVRAVVNSGVLSPAQLAQLSGRSFPDQVYLLGNFFDGSKMNVGPELKARINAVRASRPQEVLPAQQRELLGGMLNTAAAKELAGTKAGDRALAAFPGGLKITVRPCDGAYSRYDAQAGAIILDSETIQQYMRLKGYTAASLMNSPARVAEIALYMSPVVVYEAAHKMQADWTAKLGVYKPHVQEDEIEAMSLEGLYTAEKMAKDPEYARLLSSSGDFSSYASKKLGIGTEYAMSGSKKFANTVRQRYSSGLPSLDAAAAQVLDAVAGELDRRAGLPAAGKAALDTAGLGLADALEMSPEELAGSAGEMQSSVLAKIQKDFSGLGVYRSRYSASDRQGRKGLRPLKSGEQYKPGAPPPL